MTTLDIRTAIEKPTAIRIADKSTVFYIADVLEPNGNAAGVLLKDSNDGRNLRIRDREHADNLRKALDKAVELGWL